MARASFGVATVRPADSTSRDAVSISWPLPVVLAPSGSAKLSSSPVRTLPPSSADCVISPHCSVEIPMTSYVESAGARAAVCGKLDACAEMPPTTPRMNEYWIGCVNSPASMSG